jgi:hypothetical protein
MNLQLGKKTLTRPLRSRFVDVSEHPGADPQSHNYQGHDK